MERAPINPTEQRPKDPLQGRIESVIERIQSFTGEKSMLVKTFALFAMLLIAGQKVTAQNLDTLYTNRTQLVIGQAPGDTLPEQVARQIYEEFSFVEDLLFSENYRNLLLEIYNNDTSTVDLLIQMRKESLSNIIVSILDNEEYANTFSAIGLPGENEWTDGMYIENLSSEEQANPRLARTLWRYPNKGHIITKLFTDSDNTLAIYPGVITQEVAHATESKHYEKEQAYYDNMWKDQPPTTQQLADYGLSGLADRYHLESMQAYMDSYEIQGHLWEGAYKLVQAQALGQLPDEWPITKEHILTLAKQPDSEIFLIMILSGGDLEKIAEYYSKILKQ